VFRISTQRPGSGTPSRTFARATGVKWKTASTASSPERRMNASEPCVASFASTHSNPAGSKSVAWSAGWSR
jgi:hypothetical protein